MKGKKKKSVKGKDLARAAARYACVPLFVVCACGGDPYLPVRAGILGALWFVLDVLWGKTGLKGRMGQKKGRPLDAFLRFSYAVLELSAVLAAVLASSPLHVGYGIWGLTADLGLCTAYDWARKGTGKKGKAGRQGGILRALGCYLAVPAALLLCGLGSEKGPALAAPALAACGMALSLGACAIGAREAPAHCRIPRALQNILPAFLCAACYGAAYAAGGPAWLEAAGGPVWASLAAYAAAAAAIPAASAGRRLMREALRGRA